MLPDRIQRLLSSGALKENTFDDSEVAIFWNKAITNAADARLDGISLDGAIQSAYTAVFNASLAVLAHHGLRTGSARNHHENAFAGVDAFAIVGLEDLIPESTEIRSLRRSSMYDPDIADESDRDETLRWLDATLPKMYAALIGWNPALAAQITKS